MWQPGSDGKSLAHGSGSHAQTAAASALVSGLQVHWRLRRAPLDPGANNSCPGVCRGKWWVWERTRGCWHQGYSHSGSFDCHHPTNSRAALPCLSLTTCHLCGQPSSALWKPKVQLLSLQIHAGLLLPSSPTSRWFNCCDFFHRSGLDRQRPAAALFCSCAVCYLFCNFQCSSHWPCVTVGCSEYGYCYGGMQLLILIKLNLSSLMWPAVTY